MVYHILRDGTVTTDITGHVVKREEADVLYQFITEINRTGRKRKSIHKEKDEVSVC